MARLFNAYVIVDWSAASKPATGADSIWVGVLKRDVRFRMAFESHNPPTRAAAETLIAGILDDRAKRSERTLIGFDFNLGFPRGLAEGLKLPPETPPWLAVWNQLDRMVKDKLRQHQQPLRGWLRRSTGGSPAARFRSGACRRRMR